MGNKSMEITVRWFPRGTTTSTVKASKGVTSIQEAHHTEYESSYISYQELFDGILHLAESKLSMQDQND